MAFPLKINGEPWSRERLKGRGVAIFDITMGGEARLAAVMNGADSARLPRTTAEVRSKKLVVVGGEDSITTIDRRRRGDRACFRDDLNDETLRGKAGWHPVVSSGGTPPAC